MVEIKAGYKQTDIGVIPEDWDIKNYGEIFDFLSTISNSRADLCFKGDFGYIHYGDIHTRWENNLDLSKDVLPEIRRDKIKKFPASLRNGDLVMADASEDYEGIAKTVEVKNISEKKIFSGLHTLLMRDRNALFSDGIRGYIHEIPVVRQQIQKIATGLKVFGVSKSTLKNVQIPIPRPEEQKQIAAALSDVDGLIEALSRLISKKRDMKTAAMQQLLTGKKRLAGFDGAWEEKIIDDIAVCYSGGTPSTSIKSFYGGNIPWITSSDLNSYNIKSVQGRITESGLKNSSAKMIKKGTLLIALYGATAGVSAITRIDAAINQAVLALDLDSSCDAGYMLAYFRLKKNKIIETYTQGGQPNLSGNIIKNLRINVPTIEEQKAIASILADMDSEIDALEQRLGKARSLKTGMMQELLTGKTRLIQTNTRQTVV